MKQKSDKKILKVKIPKGWIPMSFKCDLEVKSGNLVMEVQLHREKFVTMLKNLLSKMKK